jgi:DNA-binding response OmpR family regulator
MIQGRAQSLSEHRSLPKLILIVEDDAVNADCLASIISRETPYYAFVVSDGLRALRFVSYIKPQLFILDCRLPDMNALELYDHLHANRDLQDIPVLILSACIEYYQNDIKARRLRSLSKPFDLDELLSTIESLLDSSPIEQAYSRGCM